MHRRRRPATPPPGQPQLTVSLRRVLTADAVLIGAGYAFGPVQWHSSPTLAIIDEFGIPYLVWGLLFIVGGLLLGASRSPTWVMAGHGFCALLYIVWGAATAWTAITGTLSGVGPVHVLALAAVHMMALWRLRVAALGSRR